MASGDPSILAGNVTNATSNFFDNVTHDEWTVVASCAIAVGLLLAFVGFKFFKFCLFVLGAAFFGGMGYFVATYVSAVVVPCPL